MDLDEQLLLFFALFCFVLFCFVVRLEVVVFFCIFFLPTPIFQVASNYQESVRIFKKFHGSVIGRGGAKLRKIKEETNTKIELPQEGSDSDVIVIIGKKENVQKAKARILAIEKDMVRDLNA